MTGATTFCRHDAPMSRERAEPGAAACRDLAYSLSTALETEDRRAWKRDLIALYLDGPRSKGVPPTCLDDAWTRY
jgi:hypothetical protein